MEKYQRNWSRLKLADERRKATQRFCSIFHNLGACFTRMHVHFNKYFQEDCKNKILIANLDIFIKEK